jgi:hypothetical protein
MSDRVAQIQRRKRLDEPRGRKPLRLRISRRLLARNTGDAEFVTQVRIGRKTALLVPRNAPSV